MELLDRIVYTNANREEQGILENFEIDVDVAGEKDFQIVMPSDVAVLQENSYWFVQGYEYGGIVDQINGDTEEAQITYRGRNTRGILNSKVVEPAYNGVRTVSGTPAEIFNTLLELCGLDSLFYAEPQEVGVEEYILDVINFLINGYQTLYDVMMAVAGAINSTIKFSYSSDDGRWHIYTELIEDFSDYLNYCQDNSIQYQTENIINSVNHLICVDDNGHAIHLFTDELGGVQPYSFVDSPIQDSQYVLDKRYQLLTGEQEYEKILRVSSKVKENYKLLDSVPDDWTTNFNSYLYLQQKYVSTQDTSIQQGKTYYTRSGSAGNYVYTAVQNPVSSQLHSYYETETEYINYDWFDTGKEQYVQVTSKPDDWDVYKSTADTQVIVGKHYYTLSGSTYSLVQNPVSSQLGNYYEYSGNYSNYYKRTQRTSPEVGYEYTPISGISSNNFKALGSQKPDDWETNFESYYYKFQTGTGYDYRTVEGIQKDTYVGLTKKPDDWATNYSSYYMIESKKYEHVKAVKKKGKNVAPDFKKNKYYRKDTSTVAPKWTDDKYYWNDSLTTAPIWSSVSSNVWKLDSILSVPGFQIANTYTIVVDNYASMVERGLEELERTRASQQQEVKLDEFDVDIGDVVGGIDDLTGYTMCEPVTNMIAKLNQNGISIEYIVGGNK